MKLIAHRANDQMHKENSFEAILGSLENEYTDGIEIDVRLTKDRKIILNHDPFYRGNYIFHTNTIKLQKLGLNTLDEVLKRIISNKIIMIEVKVDNKNINIMNKCLNKILNKYKLNFYICSFNYKFMKKFKQSSNLKCGLIISPKINENNIKNNFDFNSINYIYSKNIPAKETFRWTINSEEELNKIKNTENIITDNTAKIYKLIKQKEQS